MLAAILAGGVIMTHSASALSIGDPAPDFTAPATGGKTVTLSSMQGKWVVIYFYPKAGTPGCTKEACTLRDGFQRLQAEGVMLYGISVDPLDRQESFKEKYNVPFDLISDADKQISKKYGVLAPLGLFSKRKTFVIDPEGRIAHIFHKVDVATHADEVLNKLKELKAQR
ncbi:MAG: peroxiredoxin [Verrucomicrobia bacterium]|nr:peroxiredoxin [Verrucomicrobiota bacterium]